MSTSPEPDLLTPADLQAYMDERGIAAALIANVGETPTVVAAAAALGVNTEEILKTLIFYCRGEPYAVITHGTAPVPDRALADHFGVGKRQIKLARPRQVLALTGYPVGGVPPFGHRQSLPILLDRSVLDHAVVFGGGGDDRTMLRITPAELQRVTSATLLDLGGSGG